MTLHWLNASKKSNKTILLSVQDEAVVVSDNEEANNRWKFVYYLHEKNADANKLAEQICWVSGLSKVKIKKSKTH